MAYLRKRGKSWQAIVRLKGHDPITATFETKRAAELWAQAEEAEIRAGRRSQYPRKTLNEAIEKYIKEVSSKKRSGDYEEARFLAFQKHYSELAAMRLTDIKPSDVAAWRDDRLGSVTRGTVQRDVNLYRNLWTVARKEWGWCGDNPWSSIKLPGDNPPRTATWGWKQIKAVLRYGGYSRNIASLSKTGEVCLMFMIGLHTGMRAGEIRNLMVDDIDLNHRVIRLNTHKTFEHSGVRLVPFPQRALKVIKQAVKLADESGRLFNVKAASVDALFRRTREKLNITGLTFHDSRATFATLMARKPNVDAMTLGKILGHKDLSLVMNTYFRESAKQMAARI